MLASGLRRNQAARELTNGKKVACLTCERRHPEGKRGDCHTFPGVSRGGQPEFYLLGDRIRDKREPGEVSSRQRGVKREAKKKEERRLE